MYIMYSNVLMWHVYVNVFASVLYWCCPPRFAVVCIVCMERTLYIFKGKNNYIFITLLLSLPNKTAAMKFFFHNFGGQNSEQAAFLQNIVP